MPSTLRNRKATPHATKMQAAKAENSTQTVGCIKPCSQALRSSIGGGTEVVVSMIYQE